MPHKMNIAARSRGAAEDIYSFLAREYCVVLHHEDEIADDDGEYESRDEHVTELAKLIERRFV